MDKKTIHKIIRQTKENYNMIASEWDASRAHPTGVKKRLVQCIKPGMKVLDVGCGNGLMMPFIVERKAHYVGIDNAKKLIALAKKSTPSEFKKNSITFQVVDISKKLPFKSQSFDVILCFAVLHHIPSYELQKKVLEEFLRVLKPGGNANIIVWNVRSPWANNRFHIDKQLAERQTGMDESDVYIPWKATRGKTVNRYLHIFNRLEFKKLLKESGFKKWTITFYNRAGKKEKNGEELVVVAQK